MTERLYYTDSYLSRFEATAIRVTEGGRRVYLDRTAFYPTSGGQAHDLGHLGGVAVTDVVDEGEEIAHILAEPFTGGEAATVEGTIDWHRRWDHMQQHTAQHLLSAVWVEQFGFETVAVHFGDQVSTIELDTKEINPEQMRAVEQTTNQLCWEARAVTITFEDAAQARGLRKESARSGLLRIVSIAGLDRSACGGTHVRSTAELSPIAQRGVEKLRGRVRVEFVAGSRALRRGRLDYELAARAARELATGLEELPEAAAKVRERAAAAEKELARVLTEQAHAAGLRAYAEAVPGPDGMRRLRLDGQLDEKARATAQAFVSEGPAVAVLVGVEKSSVLVACSADAEYDAGKLVKACLARGGGSRGMAQGSFTETGQLRELLARLGF